MKKKNMNINNNMQENINFGAIVTLQSNNWVFDMNIRFLFFVF
jgi:hypothetical protein